MPKLATPLTDVQVRTAKPKVKPYKLADGGGLYLEVMPIRTFPKNALLAAMNFVIIPALIGPLLGPTVGGLIVHWLSWREIFFIDVAVGLVLFGTGIALLSWLLEIFGEHTLDPTSAAVLLLLAISLLAVYVWHAGQELHPLLRLTLFQLRTFRVSVAGGFVTRLGVAGLTILSSLTFWTLRKEDGQSISKGVVARAEVEKIQGCLQASRMGSYICYALRQFPLNLRFPILLIDYQAIPKNRFSWLS